MTTEAPTCCGCCLQPDWINQPINQWINQPINQWQNQPYIGDGIVFGKQGEWLNIPTINYPETLTVEEKEVLQMLGTAFNKFLTLPNRSQDDNSEYRDAIHRCQQLIALRVARRANPEIWNQPE